MRLNVIVQENNVINLGEPESANEVHIIDTASSAECITCVNNESCTHANW